MESASTRQPLCSKCRYVKVHQLYLLRRTAILTRVYVDTRKLHHWFSCTHTLKNLRLFTKYTWKTYCSITMLLRKHLDSSSFQKLCQCHHLRTTPAPPYRVKVMERWCEISCGVGKEGRKIACPEIICRRFHDLPEQWFPIWKDKGVGEICNIKSWVLEISKINRMLLSSERIWKYVQQKYAKT